MATMKAIRKSRPEPGLWLEEVEIPEVKPGWVLIKVLRTSICGTDLHIYKWDHWSQNRIKPPLTIGHEFVGEVVEVGEGVFRIKPGDIVTAETHVVCGICEFCRTGKAHVCKNTRILGVDINGTYAEYVVLPEENLVHAEGIPLEMASIMEPFGNAIHTVMESPIRAKTVAVLGSGPIGNMAIALAKAFGASMVIATDIKPFRLELAKKMGADVTINVAEENLYERVMELTKGRGVDTVLEMSGAPSALQDALKIVVPEGQVTILGIPSDDVSLDVANGIVMKGITVRGIIGRKMYETWYQAVALLEKGVVDLSPIITHVIPLEKYEEGFKALFEGKAGKVVMKP